jgi:group I intron endonuclease
MIGIYLIKNNINGKSYIGQSIDIENRWKNHIRCNKDYPLYRAFKKYGVENFTFEILELCDKEDLTEKEIYYYELLKPEYNQIFPNENPVFNKDVEFKRQLIFQTEEYKNKFRKSMRPETKLKISNSLKNSESHKIAHNTIEYKSKMKEILNKGQRAEKKVRMYNETINLSFSSMSECARWLDTNTQYKSKNKVSKIKAVCDKERKSAFGYKFEYLK